MPTVFQTVYLSHFHRIYHLHRVMALEDESFDFSLKRVMELAMIRCKLDGFYPSR